MGNLQARSCHSGCIDAHAVFCIIIWNQTMLPFRICLVSLLLFAQVVLALYYLAPCPHATRLWPTTLVGCGFLGASVISLLVFFHLAFPFLIPQRLLGPLLLFVFAPIVWFGLIDVGYNRSTLIHIDDSSTPYCDDSAFWQDNSPWLWMARFLACISTMFFGHHWVSLLPNPPRNPSYARLDRIPSLPHFQIDMISPPPPPLLPSTVPPQQVTIPPLNLNCFVAWQPPSIAQLHHPSKSQFYTTSSSSCDSVDSLSL